MSTERWWQFSLRGLFVAFTVVAAWLGYNVHLVKQRQEFIAALPAPFVASALAEAQVSLGHDDRAGHAEAIATGVLIDRYSPPTATTGIPTVPYDTAEPTANAIPWIRTLLGDQPYLCISYFPGPPIERGRALFPEAFVMVAKESWPWPNVIVTKTPNGWRHSEIPVTAE